MLPKKIKNEIKLFVKYKKLLKLQKLKHFSFTIRLEALFVQGFQNIQKPGQKIKFLSVLLFKSLQSPFIFSFSLFCVFLKP